MTQVAFNQVPPDLYVPIFAAEINAGPPQFSGRSRLYVMGRVDETLVTGDAPILYGADDPNIVAGKGSMAAEMLLHARRENQSGEIWLVPLKGAVGATAAVGSVTFTGTAIAAGTITRYIHGEPVVAVIKKGNTAAQAAAAFVAAVARGYMKFNRRIFFQVTAAVDGTNPAKVNLTARYLGNEGNALRIDLKLLGDEKEVPGITTAIVNPTGGAGGSNYLDQLAAISAQEHDFIVGPYAGGPALDAFRDYFAERWGPLSQLDGHYITATSGTVATLTALGATRNDPHVSILGLPPGVPNTLWAWAAALAGQVAFSKNLGRTIGTAIEIARPMQTLVLEGLKPPRNADAIFVPIERNTLLATGISTIVFRRDGQAACERIVTTYQYNDADLRDPTFLDIESVLTSAYLRRYFRNAVVGAYPRHVMLDDNPGQIQGVVTPPEFRATLIHAYEDTCRAGLTRQPDLFAQQLIVDFDFVQSRANAYLPSSLSAAMRIVAVNMTMFQDLAPSSARI